jgi:hypothetical protein
MARAVNAEKAFRGGKAFSLRGAVTAGFRYQECYDALINITLSDLFVLLTRKYFCGFFQHRRLLIPLHGGNLPPFGAVHQSRSREDTVPESTLRGWVLAADARHALPGILLLVRRRASALFCVSDYSSFAISSSSNPKTICVPFTRIGRLIRFGFAAISRNASARGGGFSFILRSRYSSFREFRNSL